MRVNAVVAGVGMTPFGKHLDKSIKWLGGQAVLDAIKDAGIRPEEIEAAYVGNCAAGTVTGQESIRGQVVLSSVGLGKFPIINIENACGSGSTALNQACMMVSAGYYDVVLVVGFEKLYHENKAISYAAFNGAIDVEERDKFLAQMSAGQSEGSGTSRSMFADFYGVLAREFMASHGTSIEHFAMVSAKTSFHGSLNPRAQFQNAMTVEEVLAQPVIVDPLTRPMICPLADGGAAAVIVSERKARQLGIAKPVRVVSSVVHSFFEHPDGAAENVTSLSIEEAYYEAGVGPKDLSLVELHDSSVVTEMLTYEHLGLCKPEEIAGCVERGDFRLGGRLPVNTSGGLLRKGHPVGASGVAQLCEVTWQLQGRAGQRQVEGARVGLCHNGGGNLGNDTAVMNITIAMR
ncbi:thiolase [Denitratisoma sp. DHT3]|uniref:thiolase family protein n=1 Tax=Denitratisoma sp. DHT3 TaxID=1981880 RepID=UPI001198401B|nr:thiolase family protein [Denitratisoma sp. DHT3]QDX82462.1 thiolase [Denitratisoma sp. DHT3]